MHWWLGAKNYASIIRPPKREKGPRIQKKGRRGLYRSSRAKFLPHKKIKKHGGKKRIRGGKIRARNST